MRFAANLLWVFLLTASAGWCDERHNHELTEQQVGSVHFATSCAKAFKQTFNERSRFCTHSSTSRPERPFRKIVKQDPICTMAQWGIAMSHYHGLWDNGDTDAGRDAIKKANSLRVPIRSRPASTLTSTRCRKSTGRTAGRVCSRTGVRTENGNLQSSYPDDSEAAIFHALTLDIIAPKTDKTFANQRKCVEILNPFAKQSNHPALPITSSIAVTTRF